MELDQRFRLLRPGARVIDLGAAPGGWTQVAVAAVKAPSRGRVVSVDIEPMQPVDGAEILALDFFAPEAPAAIAAALGRQGRSRAFATWRRPPPATPRTDHVRIVALAEAAYEFARTVLGAWRGLRRQALSGRRRGRRSWPR